MSAAAARPYGLRAGRRDGRAARDARVNPVLHEGFLNRDKPSFEE
ncbi:hypothetical protein Hoch_0480 [Haliangium ochraceum DSM 14365]|uniref:Uncharacterized protein n=1 Tax=Haliangium ochraceum (strain DSM 14365 / JCM 11303 / SMP-2) TaxID=502025 RepID=D0LK86_HALO1|nr:hypothetical protein Hoch_0480 [Haliangium ochraceum DSM 14365]